jgi:hypothetical protein
LTKCYTDVDTVIPTNIKRVVNKNLGTRADYLVAPVNAMMNMIYANQNLEWLTFTYEDVYSYYNHAVSCIGCWQVFHYQGYNIIVAAFNNNDIGNVNLWNGDID